MDPNCDYRSGGTVDFPETLQALRSHDVMVKLTSQLFCKFDSDRGGRLYENQVQKLFAELARGLKFAPLTQEQVSEIYRSLDQNNSGAIEIQELWHFMYFDLLNLIDQQH